MVWRYFVVSPSSRKVTPALPRFMIYHFRIQSKVKKARYHECTNLLHSIDDHNLARMISDTPARCILLLEDLDCAFPHSREDDSDDENERDPNMPGHVLAKSKVTLSGLLNVLDSISSEEGRVTFATVGLASPTT